MGNKPKVIHKVRAALPTYEWKKSHCLLHFAMHVGHSEIQVRACLNQLVALGEVKQIRAGRTPTNQPRYIYQLIKNDRL